MHIGLNIKVDCRIVWKMWWQVPWGRKMCTSRLLVFRQHLTYLWLENYVNSFLLLWDCSECQKALLTQPGTWVNWGQLSPLCSSCRWQIFSAMAEPLPWVGLVGRQAIGLAGMQISHVWDSLVSCGKGMLWNSVTLSLITGEGQWIWVREHSLCRFNFNFGYRFLASSFMCVCITSNVVQILTLLYTEDQNKSVTRN